MASPAEIAQGLPKTLPEDFGEWDSESSSASVPEHSGGVEAKPGSGEAPTPTAAPAPKAAPAAIVDAPRSAPLPTRERVNEDGEAFLGRQMSSAPMSANSVLRGEEAGRPIREVSIPTPRPRAPLPVGLSHVSAGNGAATLSADEFLESLRPIIAVESDGKNTKKKWMMIAAISACSILVLVILVVRLLGTSGTASTMKQAAAPAPAASEVQATSSLPKPSPSTPLAEDTAPAAVQAQPTAESQPTEATEEDAPPEVQTKMMNDQLAAPTRISRDIKKPAVENEPPPSAGFATSGTEALGGGSAVPSVFNGAGRPVVHAAPSNPVSISSGVAVGLLLEKTAPVYPAIAKSARVSGTVDIQATISTTGSIKDLRVVSGPQMLRQAALDAVRHWRYKPYQLNNQPTEAQTTIHVIFSLGG